MYMHFYSPSVINPNEIVWACGDTATIKLDGRERNTLSDLQAIAKERQVQYPQYRYVAFATARTINELPDNHQHLIEG